MEASISGDDDHLGVFIHNESTLSSDEYVTDQDLRKATRKISAGLSQHEPEVLVQLMVLSYSR